MGAKKNGFSAIDLFDCLEVSFYVVAAIAWALAALARWNSVLAIVVPAVATVGAIVGTIFIRRSARKRDKRYARELFS